jgi:hypothetical protein
LLDPAAIGSNLRRGKRRGHRSHSSHDRRHFWQRRDRQNMSVVLSFCGVRREHRRFDRTIARGAADFAATSSRLRRSRSKLSVCDYVRFWHLADGRQIAETSATDPLRTYVGTLDQAPDELHLDREKLLPVRSDANVAAAVVKRPPRQRPWPQAGRSPTSRACRRHGPSMSGTGHAGGWRSAWARADLLLPQG